MLGVALSVIIALVVVKVTIWLYRWADTRCSSGKLPPGSMGFPVIGETIEFFKPHSFNEIHPFVLKRVSRYGSLFRTSILGSKTIVSTDHEVNFEIFRQENKCFVMSYPEMIVRTFGKDSLFLKQGMEFHKYIKNITMQLLGPECLKRRFMHKINIATQEHLKTDSSGSVLEVKDTSARLIMGHMIQMMISDIKAETKSKLLLNLSTFCSFEVIRSPFDPCFWKALYNCLVTRRNATKMIKDMFKQRREKASSDD